MNKFCLILGMLALAGPALSAAEADGPDYYRVRDVAADDVLNIRAEANPHAEKVGEIPPGADCIRNLGCKGGLTMQEYTSLSKDEQAAVKRKRPRWCRVEYQGLQGWVAGRYVGEGDCGDHPGQPR